MPDRMFTLENITTGVPVFVSGLNVLTAIGLLCVRPLATSRIVGACILGWLSLQFFNLGLGRDWILEHLPYIYALHVPGYFLIGPLLRSYFLGFFTTTSAGEAPADPEWNVQLRFPGYANLIPAVVALLIYLPFYFMSAEEKIRVLDEQTDDALLLLYDQALVWVVYVGLAMAAYASARLFFQLRLFQFLIQKRLPELRHIRLQMLAVAIGFVVAIPIQYIETIELKRYAVFFTALIVLWNYLLDFRYPGIGGRIDREVRSFHKHQKYSKSRIQNLDVPILIADLERVMEDEKLYADEDLSLERVAATLGVTAEQLSELLNNIIGSDFRSYVNRFRVDAARRLLVEEPGRGILSIAFAVGFNSKTSFNRNFKQLVGSTPADYRSERLEAGEAVD